MNPEEKSLSLRGLAKLVGVSASTVSLALNESPKLPEATIRRIKEIAKTHGYRRNPKLSRILKATVNTRYKNTGEVLACLITRQTRAQWNPSNSQFLAMQARAREYGYSVEPFWFLEDGLSPQRANQILRARGIAGLLVLPPSHALRREGRLTLPVDWERFCVVEVDDTITEPVLHRVRHDHLAGITRALRELEALGYRRIGYAVSTVTEFATNHRWTAGYAYWNQMRGLGLVPLICDEYTPALVRAWLDRERPDVVISPGGELLELLRSMGIVVPAALGYASLDLLDGMAEETTGVDQQRAVQSGLAVDLLVTLLHRNARGISPNPTSWTAAGNWRPGQTCVRQATAELAPLDTLLWQASGPYLDKFRM